jgi:electron transfer flavoprotein beta subunit
MKILVCVKQVPASDSVEIDEKTGSLIRNNSEARINPYDLSALEAALWIKKRIDKCEVIAISMGPPQAEDVIRYAFAMGFDKGILMTDKEFAGADVIATAYTLACQIKKEKADLIICGRQSTDGDTGQVGPVLAGQLELAHISWVTEIINVNKENIKVKQDLLNEKITKEVNYPALITVEKDIFTPRLPNIVNKLKSKKMKIKKINVDNLKNIDKNYIGLQGSPTSVKSIFAPTREKKGEILKGDIQKLGNVFINVLKQNINQL